MAPVRASRAAIVGVLCLAEAMVLVGSFTFPALLPDLAPRWGLSATDAGWVSGLFFGGYTLAVPGLMMLTDRIDAKRVFVGGALFSAAAHALFALFADGFWTAALLRTLAGAGLAGVFMPGVKALADRVGGPTQGRAIAFYTSTFSLGTAASFAAAGWTSGAGGPLFAFWVAAATALAAAVLVGFGLKAQPPVRALAPGFDIRPILRNRRAMGFVVAYGVHAWELFGVRSWTVAFLVFALSLSGGEPFVQPTTVAAIGGLIAMVSSIAGQEAAMRFGAARVATAAMLAGAAFAVPAAFTATLGYGWAVAAMLVWMAIIQCDSGVLTAATVASAEDGRRGATLAVHASVGFSGAMLGPLVMGIALDSASGGDPVMAWVVAFAVPAVVALAGPLVLRWAGRPARPGRAG